MSLGPAIQTERRTGRHGKSIAALRARNAMPVQPPEVLHISSEYPCYGLAFVTPIGAPMPDLAPIRDEIADIREGTLGIGSAQQQLLLVLFRGSVSLDEQVHPKALRLVRCGPGVYSSYLDKRDAAIAMESAANTDGSGAVRSVRLWWGGEPVRVSPHLMRPVSRAWLWDVPEFTVHNPIFNEEDEAHIAQSPSLDDQSEAPSRRKTSPFGSAIAEGLGARLLHSEQDTDRDPFMDLRDSFDRPPAFAERLRAIGWQLAATMPGVWKLITGLMAVALVLLGVVFVVALVATGGFALLPFLIGFLITLAFRSLFGGSKDEGYSRVGGSAPRGPGMFENFLGWLAWKNPFSAVHQQLNRRVRQVEGMIARGQIDEALKLALRLGGQQTKKKKLRTIYPRELPSARAKLDFDQGDEYFSSPILGEIDDWMLRQSYYDLAEQLEEDGDYRRAAFIHSQLLGENEEAVLLLEKGNMEHEALRLAVAGKVDPVITVRLLYSCGHKQEALALAMRAGCFEQLVDQSREGDAEFHVDVVKAWTDFLIDSGQVLRAVQVTDALANQAGANTTLLELRRNWLSFVLLNADQGGFPAEAIARAVLMGTLANGEQIADFPESPRSTGDDLLDLALMRLRDAAFESSSGEEWLSVLACLRRLASHTSPEQAAFWKGAASAFLENLTHGLLYQSSGQLQAQDLDALGKLLNMASHRVLARDLLKLNKLQRAKGEHSREWTLPECEADKPRALHGCVLGSGAMLIWCETEILELLDGQGAVRWQQRLEGVTALIAAGRGNKALILRRGRANQTHISCFDAANFELREVGSLALKAQHDITNEFGWMVQAGGKIGALSLAKLTAARPSFEFLWSCSLTDRLQVTAFCHGWASASWATVDLSPDRFGVVEVWEYLSTGELFTSILKPGEDGKTGAPNPPMLWAWDAASGVSLNSLGQENMWLNVMTWSEYSEKQVRKVMAKRARDSGIDGLIPCDFGRSAVTISAPDDPDEMTVKTLIRGRERAWPKMTVHHSKDAELSCLARLPEIASDRLETRANAKKQASGRVLLADRHGRLYMVDPRSARVTQY